MIAVVDTSVWVSALLTPKGKPAELLASWKAGAFQNACSHEILLELQQVLREPRISKKYRLLSSEIDRFVALLAAQSLLVSTPGAVKYCRDPHDDHLLEAALAARAEFVVTRDDDLKRDAALLAAFRSLGVQILSVRQFLARLARLDG